MIMSRGNAIRRPLATGGDIAGDRQRTDQTRRVRVRTEKKKAIAQKLVAMGLDSSAFRKQGQCRDIIRACKKNVGRRCPHSRAIVMVKGKLYRAQTCYAHLPPRVRALLDDDSLGKSHRGKTPITATGVIREMVEGEMAVWLAPLREALEAMKPVVVGNGPRARVELFEDYRTRLAALDTALDRAYGKPKQVQEFSGPAGGPISVEVPTDRSRELEVAKILAESGAVGITPAAVAAVAARNQDVN